MKQQKTECAAEKRGCIYLKGFIITLVSPVDQDPAFRLVVE